MSSATQMGASLAATMIWTLRKAVQTTLCGLTTRKGGESLFGNVMDPLHVVVTVRHGTSVGMIGKAAFGKMLRTVTKVGSTEPIGIGVKGKSGGIVRASVMESPDGMATVRTRPQQASMRYLCVDHPTVELVARPLMRNCS